MLKLKNYHLFKPQTFDAKNQYHCITPLIDVRSEKEYIQGSIAGALNLSLLDNNQRSQIGTIYKLQSPQAAVDLGYEIVEHKLEFFKKFFSQFDKNQPIYIFCARGGFRSASVCKLLTEWDYKPLQLLGGYKNYRLWCKNFFSDLSFSGGLFTIYGKTGVGKTQLLNKLPNHIDLEKAAQHRGSIFGAIGLSPLNQKNFETQLILQIQNLDLSRPVFIEGESSKIGKVFIPKPLLDKLNKAPKILTTAKLDLRTQRIYQDYAQNSSKLYEEFLIRYQSLQKLLPKPLLEEILNLLKKGAVKAVIQKLCLNYYDLKYQNNHKKHNFLFTIDLEDLNSASQKILKFAKDYATKNKTQN